MAAIASSHQDNDIMSHKKRQRPACMWVRTRVVIDPVFSPRNVANELEEQALTDTAHKLLKELQDEEVEWTGIVSKSQQDAQLPLQFKHIIRERWHDIGNLIDDISELLSTAPSKRGKVELPIVVIPGSDESELGCDELKTNASEYNQRHIKSRSSCSDYEDRDDYSSEEDVTATNRPSLAGESAGGFLRHAALSTGNTSDHDAKSNASVAEDIEEIQSSNESPSEARVSSEDGGNSVRVIEISDGEEEVPHEEEVQQALQLEDIDYHNEEDDDSISTASATPPPRQTAVGKAVKSTSTPPTFLRRLSRRVVASLQALQP